MLRKLAIKNYKSIYDISVDLGRINVFIGENGCGKTNILEALAMAGASKNLDMTIEGLYNRGVRVARPQLTFSSFSKLQQHNKISIDIKFQEGTNFVSTLYCEDHNDIYAEWKDEEKLVGQLNNIKTAKTLLNEYLILNSDSKLLRAVKTLTNYLIFNLDIKSLRGIRSESKKTPLGINGEGLDILLSSFTKEEWDQLSRYYYMIPWLDDIIIDEKDALRFQGYKMGKSHSVLYFKDKFMLKKNMNNIFSAENANDGILHILFYLSLFISKKTPSFFAIDNIEANLNPRICRTIIKELSLLSQLNSKQALFTTHNPAILDGLNLNDDEQRLFVVYRNDDGKTQIKRIRLKPESDENLKLSEMWMRGYLGGLPKNF